MHSLTGMERIVGYRDIEDRIPTLMMSLVE
jgi:hypothetical protein